MNKHPFYECLSELVASNSATYFLDSEVKSVDLGLHFDHPEYAKSYSTLEQPYQPIHRLSIVPVTIGENQKLSWFLAECLTNKQQMLYQKYENYFGYPQEQLYAVIARYNCHRSDEKNDLLALFDTYDDAQAYAKPFAFREGPTIQNQIDNFYEECEQRCQQHGLSFYDYQPVVTVNHRNRKKYEYWFELALQKDPSDGALVIAHEYGNTFLDGTKFADDLVAFVKFEEHLQQYRNVEKTIKFLDSEQWEITTSIPLTTTKQYQIRYLIPNTSDALAEKIDQIIQEIDLCHFCGVEQELSTQEKKIQFVR